MSEDLPGDHGVGPTGWLGRAVAGFGVLSIAASIGLTAFMFRRSLAEQADETLDLGLRVASAFEHELTLREYAVEALVAEAEDSLAGRTKLTVDLTKSLVPAPSKGGYALAVPPGYDGATMGNVTGLGAPPAPGSAVAAEIEMAFSLTSGFRAVTARNPDVPWVYYVSRAGFAYLYPRVGLDDYFISTALLDEHFQYRGTPIDAVPKRTFWSGVYRDQGGKGLLATVSKTVVRDGHVIGSVSVDIGMSTLAGLLDVHAHHRGTKLHLLGHAGNDMLAPAALQAPIAVEGALPGRPFRVGDASVSTFPLKPTDWHLAVVTPRRVVYERAFQASLVYGLMALFLLASVALLAMLSRSLRVLSALTVRDPLTGLYNRRHFDEVARAELAKARRGKLVVGMAILDVDHFKKYNDHYGHQAGDRALCAVAAALKGSLRRASDVLFRIGGEELAVIASVDRPEQMRALGEKLAEAVRAAEIEHVGSPSGRMTISVGTTTVDASAWVDLEAAYQRADAALYEAKSSGRDRVAFA